MFYVVKYAGTFGYIKPWTAVRDSETFSQQFLTPSIIEGMEKKLFPEMLEHPGKILKIKRHRLNYMGLSAQQERTWSKAEVVKTVEKKKYRLRELSILTRNVMLEPNLYLAFLEKTDAEHAFSQHICLCRNEDVLLPEELLTIYEEEEFDQIEGFELLFREAGEGFKVGHNRFAFGDSMFGELKVIGNPIRQPNAF
ncbi:MAG: hypothetical protein EPGJADBJ_01881 [Saprospiraceae bacterium]|nr:hypothetical protein [Saprospiraceae bacterium]